MLHHFYFTASKNKVGDKSVTPNKVHQKSSVGMETSASLKLNKCLTSQDSSVIGTSKWTVTNCDHLGANSTDSCGKRDVDNLVSLRDNEIRVKDNKTKRLKRKCNKDTVKNVDSENKKEDNIRTNSENMPKEKKTKYLKSHLPDENAVQCDVLCDNDGDKQENGYQLLYEAFSDEELVEDFRKEKEEEVYLIF